MTDELDKLRELERAATERPWSRKGEDLYKRQGEDPAWLGHFVCGTDEIPDARFIAAFRNCAKELLDVVEAADRFVHEGRPDLPAHQLKLIREYHEALDRLKAKVREVTKS